MEEICKCVNRAVVLQDPLRSRGQSVKETCVDVLLNTEASSLVFTEMMHKKLLRGFSYFSLKSSQ